MAVNFSAQFRINEKTQSRVLRLTDTSTGFTLAKGNFSVTFSDGSTRIKTDFSSPDISAAGGFVDINLVTDSTGAVITGSYKVDFVALDTSLAGYSLSRTFDFNWVKPTKNIVDGSDVLLPEVKFLDSTSYSPSGSFTGVLTRMFTSVMPSNTPQSGTTVTGSGNLINPIFSGNYYEGIYTAAADVSVAYTHTTNSWLTILYIDLLQQVIDVQRAPTQYQLIGFINTYHAAIEAYETTNDTQFDILNEEYDLVMALYSHLIARFESATLDGSEPILAQLLDILRPYNPASYTSAPLAAFALETKSFNISDGTNTDLIPLNSTLNILGSNGIVTAVTNNTVTTSPTYGTTGGTIAQGNDARFHNAVSIGTANGLSLSTQVISLSSATTSAAGAMSAADKTKLDGIAAGAQIGTVTSIGVSMPAAFTVSNSPVTTSGTIAITATGTTLQYMRGDGTVATLNTTVVTEGTNLYYTQGRFDTAFAEKSTSSLAEGSNLYFTNLRARQAISLTTSGIAGAATYDSATGVLNIPVYQGGVTSFNTRTGAVTLSSSDVTTALGFTPENTANKGVAGGYASLDGGGLIPSTQLPSYVDDVLEYADLASFPASGTTGKIYVALDNNKIYRWSGTVYIEVSPTVGTIWGGITGTLANQTDLQSALNAKQNTLTLTTTGTSGAATLTGGALNIPQYSGTNIYNGDGTLAANRTISSGGFTLTINPQTTFNPSVTAASAIARGTNLTPTLVASANGDVLVGLDVNPTFTNGAFTGVSNISLRVSSASFEVAQFLRVGAGSSRITVGNTAGTITTIMDANSTTGAAFGSATNTDVSYVVAQVARLKIINTTGNVILQNGGTFTDAGYRLDAFGLTRFTGTTASDAPALGAELAAVTGTGTNWALAGGATNLNVGGYVHTVGSVVPLTTALAAVSGTYYAIVYTITGRTAGSITITYGAISLSGITATGNSGPAASSTAVLTITPTTDFDGTVVLSIKTIGTSSASSTLANSSGSPSIEFRADSQANTFIGVSAGRRNIALGVSSAIQNTFIGNGAGANNTNGRFNTFVGNVAGQNTSTGSANVFIGASAGRDNTTGINNVFLGSSAGLNNTTGSTNIAIGQLALFTNTISSLNTAIGHNSLQQSTGSSNAAFGAQTFLSVSGGSNNVAFGSTAGRHFGGSTANTVTTIDNSILIGQQAMPLANAQTNQIVIGHQATGLGSNTTVLGNASTTATAIYGDLLLGSTSDNGADKLQVTGSANISSSITANSFIKSGGTSAQILAANGSVITAGTGISITGGIISSTVTGGVTSFNTRTGAITLTSGDVTTALTYTPYPTPTGTTAQYVTGDGTLATFPSLTGYVPYTGATTNVNLGTHSLTAADLVINHVSGSGVAASITKGGNGEALTVVKSSGSGNAASITGGITLLDELHLNTDLADAYIASAATWNAKQAALSGTGFVKISGTTISYDNSTYAVDGEVVKIAGTQTITGVKVFNDFRLQLAAAGASQPTVFQNSSSISDGSGGYNTLGFNQNSDLFFNDGTAGNVAVLSFSNTIVRTYTLPNASGTIALTSALSSYVPTTRTITINGTTFDLSADRTYTITPSASARAEQNFTATAAQTTFTITGGYVVGLVDVFINGARLLPTDYTATNGTTVVLGTGALLNDAVTVLNYTSTIAALPTSRDVFDYTATAAQTTFTVSGGYAVGLLDVYVNGSKLTAAEFTATNGTTFVLTEASTVGNQVQAIRYNASVTGISGSGTANFVPKFTASGTIGNSAIQDSGSLITVGSAIVSTLTSGIFLYNSSGGTNVIQARLNNTSGDMRVGIEGSTAGTMQVGTLAYAAVFGNQANNATQFSTNGNIRATITAAGNVGIGTTSNISAKLVVNGKFSIGNGWGTSGATLDVDADATASNGVLLDVSYWSGSYGPMKFGTGNSERMRITSGGDVGIGISTPLAITNNRVLHINGTFGAFLTMGYGGTRYLTMLANGGVAVISTTGATPLVFETNETDRGRVTSGGNWLLGTSSDNGEKLYVNGAIRATGTIIGSDINLKKNLAIIDNPIDKLMQCNGYSYQLKENDDWQYGVIAQEVEIVLPYAVSTGTLGIKGVNYNHLIAVLIEGIKELKQEIDTIKNK